MNIPARIKDDLPFLTSLRRDLHAHPELGFEEERTSGIVAKLLEEAGIKVHRGLGGTGVVGTLQVGNGTRVIGLRADMDALAMPEIAERPYKSTVPGKMHACGHDGHTTMLLGAARHLAATEDFSGTVHFIFQPAEEGRGGAKRMVEEGLFRALPLRCGLWACTICRGLTSMRLRWSKGRSLPPPTAGASPFAEPERTAQSRISGATRSPQRARSSPRCRRSSAGSSIRCSLPSSAPVRCRPATRRRSTSFRTRSKIGGTARAYSAEVRDQLEAEIGRLAQGTAAMYGIAVDYEFERRIPPVVNDADATRRALGAAGAVFGDKVQTSFPPSTAGDDFAFFAQNAPGCYVWLGNGPAMDGALHHNTAYDFNDAAIGYGVAYWVKLVERELAV